MVSISNPFDVYKAAVEMNKYKNFLYGYSSTKNLIKKYKFNIESIKKKEEKFGFKLDWDWIDKATSTFEFD